MSFTQITGLGPVMPDGSRKIFDKEPKPFIATKVWLDQYPAQPQVGDYLDVHVDGSVTLVREGAGVSPPVAEPEPQKKTDGGESSEVGSTSAPDLVNYKYRALPVEVLAFQIVEVDTVENSDGTLDLNLENGALVHANPDMLARISPQIGDYWVVQADGYVYLNPREVFLRKYEPVSE